MPVHAVAGHLVVVAAPVTAILALVYALGPPTRRALRWPLVLTGAVTAGLAVWAGEAGGDLLEQLRAAALAQGERLPAAVQHHAKGSDALTVAIVVLGVVVLSVVWGVLRPGRATTVGARVGAALVVVAALAVLVTTGTVLAQAMEAVWSTHGLWPS